MAFNNQLSESKELNVSSEKPQVFWSRPLFPCTRLVAKKDILVKFCFVCNGI